MDDDILEANIRSEIRNWSKTALEVPNKEYNDFPVCPFAAKAWSDNKVDIQFKYSCSPEVFYEILSNYNDKYELVILVDFEYDEEPERFYEYIDGLNECISNATFTDRDMYVMGFHPDDETNPVINHEGFEERVDVSYAMIFIQRLSLLYKSSQKLSMLNYYKREGGDYEAEAIMKRRKELYRRL